MDRRRYLALAGTGVTLGLAGCLGGDDGGGGDGGNGNGGADNGSDDAADDQSSSDDSTDDGSSSDGSDPSDDNGSTDGGSGDDGSSDDDGSDDGSGDDGSSDDDGSDDPPRSDAPELLSIRETLGSDTPLFDADTVVLEGDGQSVTDPFTLDSGLAIIGFDFEGDGSVENYILELAGARDNIVVNALNPVTGAGAVPAESGEYRFDVDGPAAWALQVGQPVAPAEEIRTVSAEASGEGRAVVGPLETLETTTVSATYEGGGNFIVEAYLESAAGLLDSEIVVNELGSFEGETLMDITGILWFDIQAEGEWTLEIE